MSHSTHPQLSIRVAPPRKKHPSIAAERAETDSARTESMAAPIALAIVVGSIPLVAGAIALITALGG